MKTYNPSLFEMASSDDMDPLDGMRPSRRPSTLPKAVRRSQIVKTEEITVEMSVVKRIYALNDVLRMQK